MFNIKKHLKTSLNELNIPCYFATNFDSSEDMYFVFFIDKSYIYEVYDDKDYSMKYEITLYLNSQIDYDDISSETSKLLKDNNFKIVYEAEDYDNETKYYTKAFKLEYLDYL